MLILFLADIDSLVSTEEESNIAFYEPKPSTLTVDGSNGDYAFTDEVGCMEPEPIEENFDDAWNAPRLSATKKSKKSKKHNLDDQ